jgi:hypothetical protein
MAFLLDFKDEDFKIGSIIDDEDYERLIAMNPALKEFFAIAADGMMFIGDKNAFTDMLDDSVSSIEEYK